MNLYIFNETRRGTVFGIGTYIRELTAALKDNDINICVVNMDSDKPQIQTEETDGIRQWYFPKVIADQQTTDNQKQWKLYYRNIVYLLRLRVKDQKDLIFHLNYCQNSSIVDELKSAFVCRIVSVVHFPGWDHTVYDNLPLFRNILNDDHPDNFGENVKKTVEAEKLYYIKVDRMICLSDYMKEILCRDYGLDMNRISVIPNGLQDVLIYNEEKIDRNFLRKRWNISPQEKIILFVGRVDEIKGVIYLIKAFREVLKINRRCRLIIAGRGNYDICFQEANDICSKIIFTGLLEKKDLFEIYQIADVGVIPSLFEPFGFVAVEMMMHSLAIVATATSGLNEVVDDTCGLKIPLTLQSETVEIDTTLLAE